MDVTDENAMHGSGHKGSTELVNLKRNFHAGQAKGLQCREKEADQIKEFVMESIKSCKNSSLYISGPPGTGKTAVVAVEMENLSASKVCRVIHINCMRVSSPTALYGNILKEISVKQYSDRGSEESYLNSLEKVLQKRPTRFPVVLVLDEMDQLGSKNQDVLYRIFDWPGQLACRLLVIGIANSLDLTDRLLPRLQARVHKPKLLHFAPYTSQQIAQIVTARLTDTTSEATSEKCLKASPRIDPLALQLCAKKVAASSGDLRSALDICRRSVEIMEGDGRRARKKASRPSTPLGAGILTPKNCNSPQASCSPSLSHVSRALKDAHGDCGGSGEGVGLPLQQKLTVASALVLRRRGQREVRLGQLHDHYASICRDRKVSALDTSEFAGLLQLLEARGVLRVRVGREEVRMQKVALRLDDRGIERMLADQLLISTVLREAGL